MEFAPGLTPATQFFSPEKREPGQERELSTDEGKADGREIKVHCSLCPALALP